MSQCASTVCDNADLRESESCQKATVCENRVWGCWTVGWCLLGVMAATLRDNLLVAALHSLYKYSPYKNIHYVKI